MHRKMLRLFPDRVKRIDSRRRAGSLDRGPNCLTGNFLPMRAGKNGISVKPVRARVGFGSQKECEE